MIFKEITAQQFNQFSNAHPHTSFYQTSYWGKLKHKTGWTSHFVAVYEEGKIIAATMILEKKLILNKNIFYCPRGFLLDYQDKEVLGFFTIEIKKFAKLNHAVFIKIDPYIEYQERDVHASIVSDGYDNKNVFKVLSNLGYSHKGFEFEGNLQPRFISVLDLKDKTRKELQKNMSQTTRNLIRRNEKTGVVSREGSSEDMEVFKDIMSYTSKRKGFIDRPLSYYEDMHNALSEGDMIKLIITELKPQIAIENYSVELQQVQSRIDKRNQKLESGQKVNVAKLTKKNELDNEEITRLNKKIVEFENVEAELGKTITLGAAIYILHGGEVLSLFAGSYDHLMKYSSSYSTYWHMIEYALDHDYDTLNFYGISGNFDESNPRIGLFYFKRDFGCKVVELQGEFDLVVDHFTYRLFNFGMKLRKIIKRLKKRNR